MQALALDRSGDLWVGTFRGLDRLDRRSGRFTHVPLAGEGERPPHVLALARDAGGGLWVGTLGQGLWHVAADGARARFRHDPDDPASLPDDVVWALHEDARGRVWVGTEAGGLARVDGAAGRFRRYRHDPEDALSLADDRVLALHEDRLGRLWVGTGAGLQRFEETADAFLPAVATATAGVLGDVAVRAVAEDGFGRLWVGTVGAGIALLDPDAPPGADPVLRYRHDPADPSSLAHDAVWDLLVDRTGLLWVGTGFAGASVAEPRPELRHVRPRPDAAGALHHGVVRALLVDRGGDLWVGTDGGGLAHCPADGAGFRALRHRPGDAASLADERIWTIHETLHDGAAGGLWVGTQTALHRRRPDGGFDRWTHRPDDPASPPPGGVRALLDAGGGRLWVGRFGGGLDLFDPATGRSVHHRHAAGDPRSLGSDLVLVLRPGPRGSGTLWVGTADGLDLFDPDGGVVARFRHDAADPGTLAGDVVRALHEDAGGVLWVGTDAGLSRLAGDPLAGTARFTHLGEDDGLPDDTVYAILEDDAGRLWLSTNRGLARYDPATGAVAAYDTSDGAQALEFNGAAAHRDAAGLLYFGGVDGFNVFRPDDVAADPRSPPVVFTGFEVLGRPRAEARPLAFPERLTLSHRDRTVAFEFAALDFAEPAANRYAYRLVGLSEEWVELGPRHDVVFSGLGAGRYRLEVKGADADGVWNERGAGVDVRVLPAPWRTPWAYLGYLFAIGAAAGALVYQVARRRAVQRELNEAIRTREERLELALTGSGDALWDWDLKSGELYRAHLAEMLGYDPGELPRGHALRESLVHPDDLPRVEQTMRDHMEGRTPRYECEYRMRSKAGQWHWIHDRGLVVERDAAGRPRRIAGTFKDISRPKEVEAELRLWATVFDNTLEGVVILDQGGTVQAVNDAFCRLTGRDRGDLLGRRFDALRSPLHDAAFYREMRRTLAVAGRWRGEVHHRRADGRRSVAWVSLTVVGREAHGDAPLHYVGVASDITQRKESEEELRYLATVDPLTELPNRAAFRERLDQALAGARRHRRELAVLFADLDGLKEINDAHGHAAGDAVLREAARRFEASVRREDTVARLSGDEFTVLVENVLGRRQVEAVAKRVVAAFARPFWLDRTELRVTASVGVAVYPGDVPGEADDAETLLRHADTAMYRAKAAGRAGYRFYADGAASEG